ncbi:MAG: penicillin-binding protein 1C [Succinivibrio sp.]|nr:penicillin-binding protein 1C [Succinivibrio sp.]
MSRRVRVLILLALTLVGACLVFCYPPYSLAAYEQRSRTVYDREDNLICYSLSQDETFRFDCTKEEVDPIYLEMLLASEDARFYTHLGVDPLALGRAVIRNLLTQSITSGASTLAMQVVRRLSRNPRTLASKLKEALGATVLTCREGRDFVLRLYLTLAPFGANIEGVKAASLKWFGHLPDHLTPAEAALLVALPRAPEAIRPDRHPKAARFYRNEVLRLAVRQGVIRQDILEAATQEELPIRIRPLPRTAYQLGLLAKQQEQPEVHTFIDASVQHELIKVAEHYRSEHQDGSTLCAMVIDLRDNSVAGYLGSTSLEESYLDLPHALRSPGSSLKPFIYALAFEQHLLHPKTIVADTRSLYGTWEPRNFSRTFKGQISAAQALCLSLNIPALKVLAKVDPASFFTRFNQGRERLVLPPKATPKLALALGGLGISLYDLTELYAMLNRDGLWVKSQLFAGDKQESLRLLEPTSARAVFETLKMTQRPPLYSLLNEVSYKTGTSYGYRDALALGSLGCYTVGVWTGKPDNSPNPPKTGFTNAAPYLFEILSNLKRDSIFKVKLPPVDALSEDAPLTLKELNEKPALRLDPNLLRLEFPLGGELISPDSEGYINVRFKGGVEPIYLTVNGIPQSDPHFFRPQSDGVHHLSLIDSEGHAVGADFTVQLPHSENEQN